ncbi:DMT family transporter [Helicobacter sp. 11S02596-1]|uniref:DMT family transporter n=1 Tax=Helicobacter sp. 11S02596-1 TaxID=1476194 RepID=UPI000BA533D6|nr:DMT family transporter [Helicobacter sp. 11S02596-1]PAF44257.1 transporter [Helicobacter sp. 11S02596-1]
MNSYLKGILCCLIATLSWGGMFPVMTAALIHLDPFNFTTLRYGIAGVAFALLLFWREGVGAFSLKAQRYVLAWLFGTLGFAGFGFLVFWGQQLAGPSGALSASIMMATMPMLGLLSVWVLKHIRPRKSTFGFILLSFLGVLLVITKGDLIAVLDSPGDLIADLLIIIGALCWVLYTIGGSYFPHWSAVRYTTITTLLGMLSIVGVDGVLIATGVVASPNIAQVSAVIPHLLYMALVAGMVAVLCWNVGNKIIIATNGVLFMDVVPITAFVVSALSGVVPSWAQIIGAGITASALVLNNLNQRRFAR